MISAPLQRLLKQSQVEFYARDYHKALRLLHKVFYQIPKNSQEWARCTVLQAACLNALGQSVEAYNLLLTFAAKWKDHIFYCNLAEISRSRKDYMTALDCSRRAYDIKPDDFTVLCAMAVCLNSCKRSLEAEQFAIKATETNPKDASARSNLALIQYDLGNKEKALINFEHAIRLDPSFVSGWTNLAQALFREGYFDEALRCFMRALELDKNNAAANFGMSLLTLTIATDDAQIKKALDLYEWRWRAEGMEMELPLPILGRDVQYLQLSKRLMILAEQGYGDTFMCMRYLDTLAALNYDVTLNCLPTLHSLVREKFPHIKVTDGNNLNIENYDAAVHAMSLPRLLGFHFSCHSYIPCRPRSEFVGERRIGYVWRGNPDQGDDKRRSMTNEQIIKIFSSETGPYGISLQYGEPWKPNDWNVTAKALENIDLLITVDTGIAHLAGAMGIPTWVLLSKPCHWIYGQDGDTTRWYPSMRLFRQKINGDWSSVIEEVREALRVEYIR